MSLKKTTWQIQVQNLIYFIKHHTNATVCECESNIAKMAKLKLKLSMSTKK